MATVTRYLPLKTKQWPENRYSTFLLKVSRIFFTTLWSHTFEPHCSASLVSNRHFSLFRNFRFFQNFSPLQKSSIERTATHATEAVNGTQQQAARRFFVLIWEARGAKNKFTVFSDFFTDFSNSFTVQHFDVTSLADMRTFVLIRSRITRETPGKVQSARAMTSKH